MFDVVFVSDIYVPGGTSFQLAQNIKQISALGKRVGVVPVQLPHARGRKPINRFVREVVSAAQCEVVTGDSSIATELLIVDNPRLMAPDLAPEFKISSKQNTFFVPFPPRDGNGALSYDPYAATEVAHRFSEGDFVWSPVANYVRDELRQLYPHLELSRRNAHPIVDTSHYRFASKLKDRERIAVGRHSRPQRDKWPPNRAQFLKVYPANAPFDVQLLGIDGRSLNELIGPIPSNYRVHPFGSIDPARFLSAVDFFVYYHHPSWREALGIATVEAMATGALSILPRYMEANFEDAAIYAAPNDVRDTLHRFHRDPHAYEEQTRRARRFVASQFSAEGFSRFLADFGIKATGARGAATKRTAQYDAIFAADFASPKIFNQAFLDEAVCEAELGTRIALYNLNPDAPAARFIRDGVAGTAVDLISGSERVACDRFVVNDPQRLLAHQASFRWLEAKQATLLASYPHGQLEAINTHVATALRPHTGGVRWAPRDLQSRMWIETFDPNLNLGADDWTVRVSDATRRRLTALRASHRAGHPAIVGIVGVEEADDAKWVMDLAGDKAAAILTCYGERPPGSVLDPSVIATGYLGMDLLKWLSRLDVLLVARDRLKADNVEYLVALAEEIGIPVVTRPKNAKLRAKAPILFEAKQRAALFEMLDAQRGVKAAPPAAKVAGKAAGRRRRFLFVSQNGTGVGHVVRQIAIARKLAAEHDCLFLTMSQAIAFISAWGFPVEYFPSSVYSGVSHTDWEFWLRKKIDLTLDAWSIDCVVFDGNVPYAAVTEATAARRDVASVWIRRGMWPDSEVDRKRLRSQIYFDMVLEPLDFADEVDTGPTMELRETVHTVPPIQLLEREELLSREDACAALGIAPDKLNVLVQLGSGNNRDIQSLRETVERTLRTVPEARIYNLRWPISDMPVLDTRSRADLELFPASRFFNAFDFSVAAAGYNTAHEVLGFGLPTVFVPNETEGMDNQAGRSAYAEGQGVAVSATAADLEVKLRSMADTKFRAALRRRLQRLKLPNGAAAAAEAIQALCVERVS
jgi:UDP:flavonoid glycosyltransferase YjiC (YdhE family)